MVFSSHVFVFLFLPAVLAAYYLVPARARLFVMTLASYLFYGWANPAFVALMLLSTLIDYACGVVLTGGREEALVPGGSRSARQKAAIVASVVSNLSLLGFFKYFNFGVDTWNALIASAGLQGLRLDGVLRVVLPLGISFYTFQSMSYAIDIYRGEARPIRSFVDFACYVSMFPQLVAGPIVRFHEVSEQLRFRTHTVEKFARGTAFFAFGLAKKILLANPCGKIADTCFDAGSLHAVEAWYGVVAYAFQIYFDFSGYSDMAIGLGLMFGFVFARNFDSPYQSRSITEFWRRWHLSLSTWLRDYLYIPLGGSRRGERRTYFNLAVVMLLGGLWHGASWNFVVWGGLHGGMLAAERMLGVGDPKKDHRGIHWILPTFVVVLLAWVFFRASDLPSALRYVGSLLALSNPAPSAGLVAGLLYQPYYILSMLAAGVVVWGGTQTWDWTRVITWPRAITAALLLVVSLAVMMTQAFNPFIYFIF